MGRPPATSDDAIEKAATAIRQAGAVEELRAAQAALLPLLGLTLDQAAQAVGKNRYWVSRARTAFLEGKPAPTTHGGRRRQTVDEDEEVAMLRAAITRCGAELWRMHSVRDLLREALEERSGGAIGESTVTAVMRRACATLFPGLPVRELQGNSAAIERMWMTEAWLKSHA